MGRTERCRFASEYPTLRLHPTCLRSDNPGSWAERDGRFVDLLSTGATITALKRAESGAEEIVRVWESGGERTLCALSFPVYEPVAAWGTTVLKAGWRTSSMDHQADSLRVQ